MFANSRRTFLKAFASCCREIERHCSKIQVREIDDRMLRQCGLSGAHMAAM